jgi:SAM-dependent methyltransferase
MNFMNSTNHLVSTLYPIISLMIVGGMLMGLISIVYVSWRNGISPMPASILARHAVTKEVNRLSGSGTIVDAGSGFGTLVVHLALHCPEWKLVGIENSPIPLWISRYYFRVIAALKGKSLSRATFLKGDLYTYPYEDVNIIVCYLYPGAMKQVSRVLSNRLSPGTRIISVCFALPGWEPERIINCGDMYRTKIYVYVI